MRFRAQKQKGTARGRPDANVCQCADYCCGAAAGGGVPAGGVVPAGGGLPPGGGPLGRILRCPMGDVFCHFSNCSGVRTAFICALMSSTMALRLVDLSCGDRLVSWFISIIFCLCVSMMDCTLGFWSAVRLSCSAMRSKPLPGGRPAGGAPAGGVEGGVLVSAARKAGLHISKLPAANAVINIVLFAFIILCRVVLSWFVFQFHRAIMTRFATCQTPIITRGYNLRNTFAAACMVFSMSARLCAVEIKPASNCDGAR